MAVLTTKSKTEESNTSKLESDIKKNSHYQLGDLGLVPRPQLDLNSVVKSPNLTKVYDLARINQKNKIRLNDLPSTNTKNSGVLPPISCETTAT